MILFLLLCIMVLSWYVSFRYKRRRLYELADALPNPKGLSRFLGMLQYSFKSTDVAYEVLKEYCKFAEDIGGLIKLWAGPILLIGITRPKDVEFILRKFPEKESRERLLRAFIGDAGIYAPVSIWARRRKILVPAFSPKIVSGFLDVIISQSVVMTEQLSRRNHIGTGSFEFWPFASAYTLDNIAQTSLGVNLKAQENPELPFLRAIYRTLYLMTKRMFSVWLWPDWLYRLTPTYREMVGCNAILHGFTDKIIQERREYLKDFNMEEYNSSIFGMSDKHCIKL